jgi:hypothetical protein
MICSFVFEVTVLFAYARNHTLFDNIASKSHCSRAVVFNQRYEYPRGLTKVSYISDNETQEPLEP